MGKAIANRDEIEGSSRDDLARRAVLVVGMHRSGTSAFARALEVLGATGPRTPLPPGSEGEIHWGESKPIHSLHEEVLTSAGTSWDDPSPFPRSWYGSALADEYRARMARIVADEYGDSSPIVIKDPRICRLVPFWLSVLEMLEVQPRFVLPVRNPLEVAASLAARDGFSTSKGLLLWLRHVLDAERDTRGHPRAFVAYQDLLRDPRSSARAIRDRLALEGLHVNERTEAELEKFVSTSERHHSFAVEELDGREDVVGWVKVAYTSLLDACRSNEGPDPGLHDRLGAALASADLAYGPVLRESGRAARELREQLNERDQGLAAVRQSHERTVAEFRESEANLRTTEQRLRDSRDALSELESKLGTTEERLRTTREELGAKDRKLAGARRELEEIHGRAMAWALAARRIERSRTWRLGSFMIRLLRLLTLRRPVASHGPRELATSIEATSPDQAPGLPRIGEAGAREQLELAIHHARHATRARNWNEAAARWQAVLDRFGDQAPALAYRRLSQACRQVGDDSRGAEAVARGLERFPDDVDLHVEFAVLAMVTGAWDTALARSQAVVDRFGDEAPPLAYKQLSQACRQVGDERRAAEAVTRGLERFPDELDLHMEFAELPMVTGDWDEAVSRWCSVLDQFGDQAPASVYTRLCHAHRVMENEDAATEVVERGLERFPDDVGIHVEFAELAMAAGDWDEAVARWRLVLDRFVDEAPAAAHVGLIRALLNTGDEEAADAIAAQRAVKQRDDYQEWILANDLLTRADREAIRDRITSLSGPPMFSVLMPVYNTRPHHLRQALDSVLAQLYPHWELCVVDDASTDPEVREILKTYSRRDERVRVSFEVQNRGIAGATSVALDLASGDWIALLDHDDVLPEHSLYLMAEAVAENRDAAVLYSDSDHLDERERRIAPFFKPDWDPDLFLGQNYINHLGVYRADLARAVGGFREGYEGSQDWDFALRIIEQVVDDAVVHVPHVLYHWRVSRSSFSQTQLQDAADSGTRAVSEHLERMGMDAVVRAGVGPSWNRIQWPVPSPPPSVSAVIPTRDRVGLLRTCIDGVLDRTDYAAVEVVVVDNDSRDAETLEYLEAIGERDDVRIIREHGEFKFSRLCNRGAAASHGEIILLLNNDIDVIDPGWLHELVGNATRPEVGAVGAKLYYENESIQHAGVILGIGKNAVGGHAYRFLPRVSESAEAFGRTRLARNYSAVTAACMALRREVYEEVGGLDEVNLPVSYNDVDLCLRIRQAGYRVVWTPFAQLYHYESTSRGIDTTPTDMARARGEVAYMHEAWSELLSADPFFNPNLSLVTEDFRLATPSRARKPWRALVPTITSNRDHELTHQPAD